MPASVFVEKGVTRATVRAGVALALAALSSCAHDQPVTPTPVPRTVSGRIVETPPTQTTGVAGARVEVVDGARAGLVTTTDDNGNFQLKGVPGDFQVRASATGYTPSTRTVSNGDARIDDIQLAPEPTIVTETFRGISWQTPEPFSRGFDVHHAGEFAVTDLSFYSFEEGDSCRLELWDGTTLVARTAVERSFPGRTTMLRVSVLAGHRYELRVAPIYRSFAVLSFTHPN